MTLDEFIAQGKARNATREQTKSAIDKYLADGNKFDEAPAMPPVKSANDSDMSFGNLLAQENKDIWNNTGNRASSLPSKVIQSIASVPNAAFKSGMAVAENLPIIGPGVKGLENLAGKAMMASNNIPGIQAGNKAIETFSKNHPEITANIKAGADIASILPMGEAANAGKFAASKALGATGKVIESTAEKATPLLTRLSLKESPLAKPAFEAATTADGRTKLAQSFGRESDIGKDLLNNLEGENFSNKIVGENKIISKALSETPNIKLDNAINALEQAKEKSPTLANLPNQRKANAKINEYIAALKSGTTKTTIEEPGVQLTPFTGRAPGQIEPTKAFTDPSSKIVTQSEIAPQEFMKIRQALDSDVPWDAPEKKLVDNALVKARQAMAQDLIDNAPEAYKPAMEDLAKKLRARDEILDDIPGKTIADKADNVESYVKNIHGIGKKAKQEALKTLDETFGTNYFEQSKNAALSRQFGEESGGTPGLATRHGTGYGATQIASLGAAAGAMNPLLAIPAALQSPLIGTRTIGGLRKAGSVLKNASIRINPDIAKVKLSR